MSHTKKNFNLSRCALINISLGILILLFPFIILKSFSYALCYIFIMSTFSTLNALNINKKTVLGIFSTSLTNSEDAKGEKFFSRKSERKEFSICKVLMFVTIGISVYYAGSVLFGAQVFESYTATLYFSFLMTMLTVFPLVWHFYFTDNLIVVLKILSDSKFDNLTESHLHSMILWTLIGAWIGAFPIPLDWDRSWQTWPITCCIGASLGNSAIHLIIGFRLIFTVFKDRRKVLLNRSV